MRAKTGTTSWVRLRKSGERCARCAVRPFGETLRAAVGGGVATPLRAVAALHPAWRLASSVCVAGRISAELLRLPFAMLNCLCGHVITRGSCCTCSQGHLCACVAAAYLSAAACGPAALYSRGHGAAQSVS